MIISILIFLIIFSVIVISHEFGHYAIARRNGIRVNEFDIGMGPVLYRKKGKETDFCIRLLPIGGACIFDGLDGLDDEEEQDKLDEHSFPKAPVRARIAAVLAAGKNGIRYALAGGRGRKDKIRGIVGAVEFLSVGSHRLHYKVVGAGIERSVEFKQRRGIVVAGRFDDCGAQRSRFK